MTNLKKFSNENFIKNNAKDVIEVEELVENPVTTFFNENAFEDGHLKEYPLFR